VINPNGKTCQRRFLEGYSVVEAENVPQASANQRLPVNFRLAVGTMSQERFAGITRLLNRLLVAERAFAAIPLIALRRHGMCRGQVRLKLRQEQADAFSWRGS
jgi:hypothetical protein